VRLRRRLSPSFAVGERWGRGRSGKGYGRRGISGSGKGERGEGVCGCDVYKQLLHATQADARHFKHFAVVLLSALAHVSAIHGRPTLGSIQDLCFLKDIVARIYGDGTVKGQAAGENKPNDECGCDNMGD
jgi:hypothetical protein